MLNWRQSFIRVQKIISILTLPLRFDFCNLQVQKKKWSVSMCNVMLIAIATLRNKIVVQCFVNIVQPHTRHSEEWLNTSWTSSASCWSCFWLQSHPYWLKSDLVCTQMCFELSLKSIVHLALTIQIIYSFWVLSCSDVLENKKMDKIWLPVCDHHTATVINIIFNTCVCCLW